MCSVREETGSEENFWVVLGSENRTRRSWVSGCEGVSSLGADPWEILGGLVLFSSLLSGLCLGWFFSWSSCHRWQGMEVEWWSWSSAIGHGWLLGDGREVLVVSSWFEKKEGGCVISCCEREKRRRKKKEEMGWVEEEWRKKRLKERSGSGQGRRGEEKKKK